MTTSPRRFAFTSLAGFAIAAVSVLGGLLMERGELRDVGQVTAALIVFGGTLGSVLVSTPTTALLSAFNRVRNLVWEDVEDSGAMVGELIGYSRVARASGVLSLDSRIDAIGEPFLRKGMMMLVDGVEGAEIRRVLELDLIISENHAENDAKVLETAGGVAPTIGIIGAVLGLIQVMKHLESLSDVGHGIAVAFVATVYGVGLANLVLLPIAGRIRFRSLMTSQFRELMIEGIIGIHAGTNPGLLGRKLEGFATERSLAAKGAVVTTKPAAQTSPAPPAPTVVEAR